MVAYRTFLRVVVAVVAGLVMVVGSGCQSMMDNPEWTALALAGAAAYGSHASGNSDRDTALIGVGVGAVSYAALKYFKHRATEQQKAEAEARARAAEAEYAQAGEKPPKYIAVPTSTSAAAPAGTQDTVMVYDTEMDQMIDDQAYALEQKPTVGAPLSLGDRQASYVGGGGY